MANLYSHTVGLYGAFRSSFDAGERFSAMETIGLLEAATGRPVSGRRAGRGRSDVLEAAARVITERGADATRFTDVSLASKVPVSSLQYYFGSREDLLIASFRFAVDAELASLRARLESVATPWDQLSVVVDAALSGVEGAPHAAAASPGLLWIEAWRFALRDAELRADVLAGYAQRRSLIESAVRAGIDRGDFSAGLDPAGVAVQALALTDGVTMPVALGEPELDLRRATDLVLRALAAIVGYAPAAS
jgi:AcrR family transcriptional regulator